jgi:TolA-binding protein
MPLIVVILGGFATLLTVTASLAAVWRVGRLKTLHETAERAAAAWQEERDAAVAKATRLEDDIQQLEGRVKELEEAKQRLEERTDLTTYFERQERNHRELLEEQHQSTMSVKSLAVAIETLATMLRPLTAAS